jgi:hypothetical protein
MGYAHSKVVSLTENAIDLMWCYSEVLPIFIMACVYPICQKEKVEGLHLPNI